MSDGPHRSLDMRKAWKTLAQLADTPAFQLPEVTTALTTALSEDWGEEVDPALLASLRRTLAECGQASLFEGDTIRDKLQSIRREAAGRPLALTLTECAERVVTNGLVGDAALEEAARKALSLHITRGIRQVEEHYLRKVEAPRATEVRQRAEGAAQQCSLDVIARRLTNLEPGQLPHRSDKKDGVDDGVPL